MLLKTRGIVFRAIRYGETSVIADLFTEEKGLHTFIAGSVRTAKSRMPFSLFQPMMVVDCVAYYRNDPGALNRLKEIKADMVLSGIPFDIRRGAVALFMAELCRKCIHEEEENRELFDFLINQINWLDQTSYPIANIHLHFLLHLSEFMGFQPVLDSDLQHSRELFFDLKEGSFTSTPPLHTHYIEPEATRHMLELLESSLENCHEVQMNKDQRKSLLFSMLRFFELHVPGFTGINTPEILEMVMDS